MNAITWRMFQIDNSLACVGWHCMDLLLGRSFWNGWDNKLPPRRINQEAAPPKTCSTMLVNESDWFFVVCIQPIRIISRASHPHLHKWRMTDRPSWMRIAVLSSVQSNQWDNNNRLNCETHQLPIVLWPMREVGRAVNQKERPTEIIQSMLKARFECDCGESHWTNSPWLTDNSNQFQRLWAYMIWSHGRHHRPINLPDIWMVLHEHSDTTDWIFSISVFN